MIWENQKKKLTLKYETKNGSFVDVFENRMARLKGKKKRISVIVDVTIGSDTKIKSTDVDLSVNQECLNGTNKKIDKTIKMTNIIFHMIR